MSLVVLSDKDVSRITATFTPHVLMALMALVFVRSSESSRPTDSESPNQPGAVSPLRTVINTTTYTALFMPARIHELATSIKVVSVPKTPSHDGLPGSTLVLDEQSGAVKAIVNAKGLTALRTAAGKYTCITPVYSPLKET